MAFQINNPLQNFAMGGTLGALSAALVTDMPVIGGFYFGGAFCLVRVLVSEGTACLGNSQIARTARFALSVLAAIAAGVGLSAALGVTVIFEAGQILVAVFLIVNSIVVLNDQRRAGVHANPRVN